MYMTQILKSKILKRLICLMSKKIYYKTCKKENW